jgi:16S rRNA (uracil1498-N3)-methyltransferase
MTRRRWIADEVLGNRAFLTCDHARHLAQVLRAKSGQEFDIATGGEVRRGKIISIAPDRVEFELGEILRKATRAEITVAISIFKFDRMEWAIEKCAELGVAGIVPVIAARTEKHLAQAASKRAERWRKIAKQSAQQSRQASAPEILDPLKLSEVLRDQVGLRIVLSEAETSLALRNALPPNTPSLTLAFGPEGGWREDELAAFAQAGWTSASLGQTILRAETAVIAAVAVCASMVEAWEA